MQIPDKPVYYADYLNLEVFLNLQCPKSKSEKIEAHDETLFIIVHQAFELWFKQIIHELKFVLKVFNQDNIPEKSLISCLQKLERIIKIQMLFPLQMDILETMTPMDFLEFRDLLVPASGFQSYQFREIEIRLGLLTKNRQAIDRSYFLGRLSDHHRQYLKKIEKIPNLFMLVEQWLERLPFTSCDDFNFWDAYKKSVKLMLENDRETILSHPNLDRQQKNIQIENLEQTKQSFHTLLSMENHKNMLDNGKRKFSHNATLNALFIILYREEPLLSAPYKFLELLMNIDENFTTWRYKHALLAQRMLGSKIGTGGTSGHQYLKMAAENNSIFSDLFNLSTFIIPKSSLPRLPKRIQKMLHFNSSKL